MTYTVWGDAQEARNAELQEKFENAVPSIKEKLEVEATRRKKQREDIEALRNKLDNFAEQTKLRCEASWKFTICAVLCADGLLSYVKCSERLTALTHL